MNTCDTCRYWEKLEDEKFGSCSKWNYGYYTNEKDLSNNDIIVENDEGWGAAMGPKFGCVLWDKTIQALLSK